MPECGSQAPICDLPIRFDTYVGCTHNCTYCFVKVKRDITKIKIGESVKALKDFISGKRNGTTSWCDWDIPLHWGGVSDPFQPCELIHRNSFRCLKVFTETKHPFVVSTKGKAIGRDEYLELLKQCNCVIQISLISPKFDKLENGATTFKERIEIIKKLSSTGKRVNVRIQPYVLEAHQDILNQLKLYSEIGVYGITVEGIKYKNKLPGLVKIGGDFSYPSPMMKSKLLQIKNTAHKYGLKFYSGENRFRTLGDDLCCCGIDGLEGFKGNTANLNHLLYDKNNFTYTEKMSEPKTGNFAKTMTQNTKAYKVIKDSSYKEMMDCFANSKVYVKMLCE